MMQPLPYFHYGFQVGQRTESEKLVSESRNVLQFEREQQDENPPLIALASGRKWAWFGPHPANWSSFPGHLRNRSNS